MIMKTINSDNVNYLEYQNAETQEIYVHDIDFLNRHALIKIKECDNEIFIHTNTNTSDYTFSVYCYETNNTIFKMFDEKHETLFHAIDRLNEFLKYEYEDMNYHR
jgi:hypothetical protein